MIFDPAPDHCIAMILSPPRHQEHLLVLGRYRADIGNSCRQFARVTALIKALALGANFEWIGSTLSVELCWYWHVTLIEDLRAGMW